MVWNKVVLMLWAYCSSKISGKILYCARSLEFEYIISSEILEMLLWSNALNMSFVRSSPEPEKSLIRDIHWGRIKIKAPLVMYYERTLVVNAGTFLSPATVDRDDFGSTEAPSNGGYFHSRYENWRSFSQTLNGDIRWKQWMHCYLWHPKMLILDV